MRGLIKPLAVIIIYHLLVGIAVLSTVSTEKPLSVSQKVAFIVTWPIVVGATNYLQERFVATMEDIKETLGEINSGRWERKVP